MITSLEANPDAVCKHVMWKPEADRAHTLTISEVGRFYHK